MNIRELEKQATEMGSNHQDFIFNREKFAALVAAHEREECAKTAEDKNTYYSTDCGIDVATDIADAIRARGKA